METRWAEFGSKKKTCLLNGSSLGNSGGPASQVRVSKNLAQTRPVAIPNYTGSVSFNLYYCFTKDKI